MSPSFKTNADATRIALLLIYCGFSVSLLVRGSPDVAAFRTSVSVAKFLPLLR